MDDVGDDLNPGFSRDQLLMLLSWEMPFGRYAGSKLIELPEAYLLWFERQGFPPGQLGKLLQLCLQLKIDGSAELLRPLQQNNGESL